MPKRKAASSLEQGPGGAAAEIQDLPSDVEGQLVRDSARLVLFNHSQRLPTARPDIRKVFGAYGKSNAVLEHIIRKVKSLLLKVFGFELVEVSSLKNKKAFILRTSQQLVAHAEAAPLGPSLDSEAAETGLLMATVTAIALSRGELRKQDFWDLFKCLGLSEADKDHPQLGNVGACLARFTKQMYIEQENQKNADGTTMTVLRLGARAKAEIIQQNLQSFLDNLYGENVQFELGSDGMAVEAEGYG